MVGVIGFEPTTLWSQTRCATKLRHTPKSFLLDSNISYLTVLINYHRYRGAYIRVNTMVCQYLFLIFCTIFITVDV